MKFVTFVAVKKFAVFILCLFSWLSIDLVAQEVNPFELVDSIRMQATKAVQETNSNTIVTVPVTQQPQKRVVTNPFELQLQDLPTAESSQVQEENLVQDSLKQESKKTLISTMGSKPKPKANNIFVFWMSLISGLLIAIVLNSKRNIFTKILQALRNSNYLKLLQKEEFNGLNVRFILFNLVYVINMSIFLWFVFVYFEWPVLNYNIFLISIIVLLSVVLKHLSLHVLSYLRKRLPDALNFSFIIILNSSLTGILLIPINLMLAFGPENMFYQLIVAGIILIIISLLFRSFRGFVNSIRIVFNDSFHFLLYLCTCEIVPMLILIAYVRNLIN